MLIYDLGTSFGICDTIWMNWTHETYYMVMDSVYEYERNGFPAEYKFQVRSLD
jgi:hypothetical protein